MVGGNCTRDKEVLMSGFSITRGCLFPGEVASGESFDKLNIIDDSFVNNVTFRYCDFESADLKGITFNDCIFETCNMKSASFADVQMYDCKFTKCDFSEAGFEDVNIEDCLLELCDFIDLIYVGMLKFSGTKLSKCIFSDFDDVTQILVFNNCKFFSCTFSDYWLMGVTFEDSSIWYTCFDKLKIERSEFLNCQLYYCPFDHIDFDKMLFSGCSLQESTFKSCRMTKEVKFKDTEFVDTVLFDDRGIPVEVTENIIVSPFSGVSIFAQSSSSTIETTGTSPYMLSSSKTHSPAVVKPKEPVIGKYKAVIFKTSGV